MQPKRDPNDRRFWPLAYGGTGHGFTGKPREDHPRRYAALARARDRVTMALPSIDAVRTSATPEAIRLRARLTLDRALDRVDAILDDTSNELKLTELGPTLSALGRISGVATEEQKTGDIRIHIVRDAPPMPEQAPPHALLEVQPAKDIGLHDLADPTQPIAVPSTLAASPHASREVGDVTAYDAIGYDDGE